MRQKTVFPIGLLAMALLVTGLWWYAQRNEFAQPAPYPPSEAVSQSPDFQSHPSSQAAHDRPQSVDSLARLAQHHCAKLQSTEQVASCEERLQQAALQGDFLPQTTSFDAQACDSVTDPMEQHQCHARLGLDFALSTGDIERCQVIPMDELKAICRIAITVNEVKKLYALENELAKRPE